jgi:sensor domain CHASE-containing protein
MKLTKRITLITAIVFAVAGIILAAVSVAVVHGNFKLLSRVY